MVLISRWRITGLVAIVLVLISGCNLLWLGFNEETVRLMIRTTARISVSLFVLAFTASSLHYLFRRNWTGWLLRNRRYIGVSFALSHFVHLLFLIQLLHFFPDHSLAKLSQIEVVLASVAYVFILLMVITSFDGPRGWIGEKLWHGLHTTGMYLVWLIFVDTFGFGTLHNINYLPLELILLLAMGLRLARAIKRKS